MLKTKKMVCVDASPTFLYSRPPHLTKGKVYEVQESPATGTVLVMEPDVTITHGKWVPTLALGVGDKFGDTALKCVDPTAEVGSFNNPTRYLRSRFAHI